MMESAISSKGVLIRLTHERWAHIIEEHGELAGLRPEVLETVAPSQNGLSMASTGRCWQCVRWRRVPGW